MPILALSSSMLGNQLNFPKNSAHILPNMYTGGSIAHLSIDCNGLRSRFIALKQEINLKKPSFYRKFIRKNAKFCLTATLRRGIVALPVKRGFFVVRIFTVFDARSPHPMRTQGGNSPDPPTVTAALCGRFALDSA